MTTLLVDRIYEAAALPELWPDLLHDVSVHLGFVGGVVTSSNARFERMVASRGMIEAVETYRAGAWGDRNIRRERAMALGHPGFVRDQDLVSDHELETHPLYAGLLRPLGLGYCAGSQIRTPNGDTVVFAFDRALALGPTPVEVVRELDELRPHFARAAVFSGRLDSERSRAQVSALAEIGLPAAILGAARRVIAANSGFVAMSEQVRIGARDVLSIADAGADALLGETVAPGGRAGDGRSIPLRTVGGRPPAVLHVLPFRRGARDLFSHADWLLVVTPLGIAPPPAASILSGLFDLSPAEAKVAKEVIGGGTVAGIASSLGLSEATVRTQLRGVFAKTGTSRQSELVSVCGGVALASRR